MSKQWMMYVAPGEVEWGKARAWEYQRDNPGETVTSVQASMVLRPGMAILVDPEMLEFPLPPFERHTSDQDDAWRYAIRNMPPLYTPPALPLRVTL